ncbi:MAG: response regulator transcription factor [Ktedonobacterales bacterium]|nr:response regulator transcription factor [Ktedonobacterales bacterium]
MQIFLVEDEPRLARSYGRNLEEEGHSVTIVHDGEAALDVLRARHHTFDVIVLDVLLPHRDGISVCRELRAMGIATPVLLLTALGQTEDKVLGLDAGADDYLTKPVIMDELLARLRALVRRGQGFDGAEAGTTIRVADLVLDVPRHQVLRAGREIVLTPQEYRLLEILANNANRVMTRQQLQERIWPEGTEAGSNVLDTYIHYLRDKVDRDAEVKLIQTVRGIGFTLRDTQGGSR